MVAGPHGGREAIPAVRVAGDAVEHDEGLGAGVGIPQRDRRWVKAVDGEGGALLEFDVRAPDAFLRWLLPFGSQADLLEPADLRAALAGLRQRVLALYR